MENNLIFLCLTKTGQAICCDFNHDKLCEIAKKYGIIDHVAIDLSNKEEAIQMFNLFFKGE